jgi:uncharacterized membrane protein YeiH
MDKLHSLYYILDLTGAFVFAISGATAAKQRGLDIFGICAIAFTVACGGGIIRDLCIGAIPPAGLTNWRYLVTALLATIITLSMFSLVRKLARPVLVFDAIGLALFAVTGAEKTLAFGHNPLVAILLGTTTAVGGGVLRDILLNRVPVILQKEIYALAALIGSCIVVAGTYSQLPMEIVSIIGIAGAATLRLLALHFRWNLPSSKPEIISEE